MELKNLIEKRAIDLTAGELAKVLASELSATNQVVLSTATYSFKGIMEIFQCSKSKAMGIRASGVINDACIQNGNSFLVDRDLALTLMRDKSKPQSYKRQNA